MSRIRVGCAGWTGRAAAYWKAFDVLELSEAQSSARAATHRRWRTRSPADIEIIPQLSPDAALAGFQGAVAARAWTDALATVERLGAQTLWVRTPPSFRPSRENRDALTAFFRQERPEGLDIAWRAEGLWDSQPEDRNALCERAGLLPIIDPLALDEEELEDAEVFPQGPAVYWRLLGRPGGGTRFSESHFDLLVSLLEGRERGAVIFGAAVMAGDARRFRTLLQLAGQAVADEALDDDAEVDGEDADDFEPDDEET
jgi:uncharacterized protein YecE (DUF72 family)